MDIHAPLIPPDSAWQPGPAVKLQRLRPSLREAFRAIFANWRVPR